MGRALLYYECHSRLNRLRARLQRLRQPKYLFGAMVGGLYFYWYLFGACSAAAGGAGRAPPCGAGARGLGGIAGRAGFLVVLLLMWIIPHQRAALMFTEAEVAFLFPAPVGRRTLINFKLLKSQAAILFSALFMTLIGRWGGGGIFIPAFGWWGLLSIVNLQMLGSSFARTMLLDRGISNWRRRLSSWEAWAWWWPASSCGRGRPCRRRRSSQPGDFSDFAGYTGQSGIRSAALAAGAVSMGGRADICVGRKAILPRPRAGAGHHWAALFWVIRSNVAFEEASVELSRKFAERIAAARSGNWQAMSKPKKGKRPPFELRPEGWPAMANLLEKLDQRRPVFRRTGLDLPVWIMVFVGGLLQDGSGRSGGGGS